MSDMPQVGTRFKYDEGLRQHQNVKLNGFRSLGHRWEGVVVRTYDLWAGHWRGGIDVLRIDTGELQTLSLNSWQVLTNVFAFNERIVIYTSQERT
jgi:hypothetical protein